MDDRSLSNYHWIKLNSSPVILSDSFRQAFALFTPNTLSSANDAPLFVQKSGIALGRYAPKRLTEFVAGRLLMDDLLRQLHPSESFSCLAIGRDGEPIFPKGVTGSISHTNSAVWVAATNDTSIKSVGIDVEEVLTDARGEELKSEVVHPNEEPLFDAISAQLGVGKAVTLFFSTKESFYKATFPLHRTILEFKEVTVKSFEWSTGVAQVRLTGRGRSLVGEIPASIIVRDDWLFSSVVL